MATMKVRVGFDVAMTTQKDTIHVRPSFYILKPLTLGDNIEKGEMLIFQGARLEGEILNPKKNETIVDCYILYFYKSVL